jgi:uncharacterized membrane protein
MTKRTLLALAVAALAATAATPAVAAAPPSGAGTGITYTVSTRGANGLAAACHIVADRWTADYGPTDVTLVATAPAAIWTRVRCTVTKNGTTYVDQETTQSGSVVTYRHGAGTIPVAGIQVCVEAEAQLTVDARPTARSCIAG